MCSARLNDGLARDGDRPQPRARHAGVPPARDDPGRARRAGRPRAPAPAGRASRDRGPAWSGSGWPSATPSSSCCGWTLYRNLTRQLQGEPAGAEGSIVKLYWSELYQRITELALDVLGPASQIADGPLAEEGGRWQFRFLKSRGDTHPLRHEPDPAQHHRRAAARPAALRRQTHVLRLQQGAVHGPRQRARVPRASTCRRAGCASCSRPTPASTGACGRGSPTSGGPRCSCPRSTAASALGFLDLALLLEESGRALLPGPARRDRGDAARRAARTAIPAQRQRWLPGHRERRGPRDGGADGIARDSRCRPESAARAAGRARRRPGRRGAAWAPWGALPVGADGGPHGRGEPVMTGSRSSWWRPATAA